MTPDLFRIVYLSRNAIGPASSEAELSSILAAARRNNARQGVTGALLYNAGVFAQALEGTFEAVQSIFERIQVDHRHCDVVVLEAQPTTSRMFGEWAMAHAKPADPAGANAFLSRALASAGGGGDNVLMLLDRVVRAEPVLYAVHA